jgi:uncharacterized protein
MLIDVRDILKAGSLSKNVDFCVLAQDCGIEAQDCAFSEPLRVSAELTNVNGIIRSKGQVLAVYETFCARCLAPVRRAFEKRFDEEFIREDSLRGTDDAYGYAGREVDMGLVLRDAVLLEIPIRHLCREDCKSLCPKCGRNLNAGDCACGEALGMAPFEALEECFRS